MQGSKLSKKFIIHGASLWHVGFNNTLLHKIYIVSREMHRMKWNVEATLRNISKLLKIKWQEMKYTAAVIFICYSQNMEWADAISAWIEKIYHHTIFQRRLPWKHIRIEIPISNLIFNPLCFTLIYCINIFIVLMNYVQHLLKCIPNQGKYC